MEIFKLVGSIMVDSADAQNSISKTGDQAEKMGSKLASGAQMAMGLITNVAGLALEVGKAVMQAAEDFGADMDVIDKASQRMGITAERYQELAYAAGLCGVEMSTMERAAKKLEGTDMSLDDALNQIMSLEDETERMTAAADMFGDAIAYQMTPLLKAGADGLADMSSEANDLGLVMSNETVAAGATLNDSISKIQQTLSAVGNQLMSRLLPYIQKVLDYITSKLPAVMKTVTSTLDKLMPIVEPIFNAVMSGIMALWNIFSKVVDAVSPYIEPVVAALTSMMEGTFALLSGDFSGFIDGIIGFFQNAIPVLMDLGGKIIGGLWDGLKGAWGLVESWFGSMVDRVKGWFQDIRDSIVGWFGWLGIGGGDTDGSHAAGLASVPFDGYQATLHRGETVLNANDTSELISMLRRGNSGQDSSSTRPIQITVQSVLDGRIIGESVVNYQRNRERAFG